MSQENSEIALQQIEALNRRDVDAFVALASPDVEWEDSVFWSEPARTYRGKAELREWVNRVLEPWESFHIEVDEVTEAADDRVFIGGVLTTRGKGSGVETQLLTGIKARASQASARRAQGARRPCSTIRAS